MRDRLTAPELKQRFGVYFKEMEGCDESECYWALLHLVLVMPAICAALEQKRGHTRGRDHLAYVAWCEENFSDKRLSAEDRYAMRCKILHQGNSLLDSGKDFSFEPPPKTPARPHLSESEGKTIIAVRELYEETQVAVHGWFEKLAADPTSVAAANVSKNLDRLVKVKAIEVKPLPGVSIQKITTTQ